MKILVNAKNQAHAFECGPGEKILHAGLRQSVELPYECATGTCGTCRARLATGEVESAWPEAPGHAYLKAAAREFLMCQALARTDCTLQVSVVVKPSAPGAPLPRALGAVLRRYRALTHDVASFDLDLEESLDFESGQFALVSVPGIPGARAYSMVNFARAAERLSFVVKKKPGGAVSEWLFGSPVEGTRVGLVAPLGHATFHPDVARHVLCIAGGSGIAGMMSILSRACAEGYFRHFDGHVFFGVRTARDGFFLDELAAFRSQYPERLRITIALSDEDPSETLIAAYRDFAFARGLVHRVAGDGMKGRFDNVRAWAAGPPPMVDATRRMLVLEGRLASDNIRYDKFS